jgi:hypothetical protein
MLAEWVLVVIQEVTLAALGEFLEAMAASLVWVELLAEAIRQYRLWEEDSQVVTAVIPD